MGTVADEDMEAIARLTRVRSLKKKWMVVHAGEPFQKILWVAKGALRLYHVDSRSNEFLVELASAGHLLADWNQLRTGNPTKFHIDVVQDAEVVVIPRENRDALVDAVPLMDRVLRIGALTSLARYQARIAICLKSTADDRFRLAEQTFPELGDNVPSHLLAKFLCIDPATLSRMRGRLRKELEEKGKEPLQ